MKKVIIKYVGPLLIVAGLVFLFAEPQFDFLNVAEKHYFSGLIVLCLILITVASVVLFKKSEHKLWSIISGFVLIIIFLVSVRFGVIPFFEGLEGKKIATRTKEKVTKKNVNSPTQTKVEAGGSSKESQLPPVDSLALMQDSVKNLVKKDQWYKDSLEKKRNEEIHMRDELNRLYCMADSLSEELRIKQEELTKVLKIPASSTRSCDEPVVAKVPKPKKKGSGSTTKVAKVTKKKGETNGGEVYAHEAKDSPIFGTH